MRRVLVVLPAVVLLGLLFPVPAGAQQGVITAFLFRYNPSPVELASGDTLVFLNADPLAGEGHSVTHAAPPGERLFDSTVVLTGDSDEVNGISELKPGSYNITCRVHAFMAGILKVGGTS